MRLPVRHSIPHNLHEEFANLPPDQTEAEEFAEIWKGECEETTDGLHFGDGEDELSVLAERGVLLFEAFAFEAKGTGTDDVGCEAGEDFFGVEGFVGSAVALDGFYEVGGAFHEGGEHQFQLAWRNL